MLTAWHETSLTPHCLTYTLAAVQDYAEQVFSELSTTIAQAVGPAVDALLQLRAAALASKESQASSVLTSHTLWLLCRIMRSRSSPSSAPP